MANNERQDRIVRLDTLRERDIDPYPATTRRTHHVAAVAANFDTLQRDESVVVLAGRVRAIRSHGKSAFAVLEDSTGRMQGYIKRDKVGEENFGLFELLDVGDFAEFEGTAFHTKSGEASLFVTRVGLLTKSIRPLPEKWHGLTDVETRYRHRELDLLANPSVRAALQLRGRVVDTMRVFFRDRDFLEVETPVLQPIPGGAAARPFKTHHHALDQDLYLRVAPELYLKRLVTGGFERVFEVSRCFRNEGIDRNHNPEFTQIEAYQAYADYEDLMELIEALFLKLVTHALPHPHVEYDGATIELAPPFPRRSFLELVLEYSGVDIATSDDDALRSAIQRSGGDIDVAWGRGKLMDELYKTTVRPALIQPTFVMNHPVELSPLAKRRPEHPSTVERFQLVLCGMEVVNAFSELNDPLDQRARFEEQQQDLDAGDEEAMRIDENFLAALEVGMPPTAGLGIGIDRLAMIVAGASNLKEVIAFPALRQE